MPRITKPQLKSGTRLKVCCDCPYAQKSTANEYPAFSFAFLQDGHGIEKCTAEEKISLLNALHRRSKLRWADLEQADKHGLGKENININAITESIPSCVKEDTKLWAFRFKGNAPFVGFRDGKIFYILWIDRDFKLYNHG